MLNVVGKIIIIVIHRCHKIPARRSFQVIALPTNGYSIRIGDKLGTNWE